MTEAELAPDGGMIDATYRTTRADLLNATIQLQRGSPHVIVIGAWATTLSLGAIVMTGDLLSLAFLAFGVALLSGAWCLPFVWLAIRRRPDLILTETRLRVDRTGIDMSTALASSRLDWAAFRRVREMPGAFLLDFGTGANMVIPTRVLDPAERQAFRELVDSMGKLEVEDRLNIWKWAAIGAIAALMFLFVLSRIAA